MPLLPIIRGLAVVSLFVSATAVAEDIPASVHVDTSGELPLGLTIKQVTGTKGGQVERVVSWNEGDGGHVAVFAHIGKEGQRGGETWYSATLYGTTFQVIDGRYTQVQAIKEAVQPCNLDMTARFLERSITLTNLDDDGEGELTFGYVTRCAGDVSPLAMKVLMLEGKAKYALRGDSRVDLGDGIEEGGAYRADFKKAPPAFLAHAKKIWAANMDVR